MSKNKHLLSILLAGSLLCLSACGNQAVSTEAISVADGSSESFLSGTENYLAEEEEAENAADNSPESLFSDTENLFAEDAEAENIPHGSIVHGSDSKTFTYSGETLEIPYYAEGSGLGANCGFLLFLDGIPQPYKIESDGSCSWLHRLSLTDNVRTDFSFYLEPVTGKAGEMITLTILSLSPQSFEEAKGLPLGTSQNFLENCVSLVFETDAISTQPDDVLAESDNILAESDDVFAESDNILAESDNVPTEPETVPTKSAESGNISILRNLSVSDEELTPENIDSYLSDGTGTPAASIGELSTRVFQICSLSEDGTEFSHILLGHPDARYRTTLFLDYVPLWFEGSCCMDRNLMSGLASCLDVKLDLGTLAGTHILSVLSVPLNASDFPDDVLITETWSVILGDTQ